MHGPAGGGKVVWEIWKKYPAASQAKNKLSCMASPEGKKKSCMHGAAKEKILTNH